MTVPSGIPALAPRHRPGRRWAIVLWALWLMIVPAAQAADEAALGRARQALQAAQAASGEASEAGASALLELADVLAAMNRRAEAGTVYRRAAAAAEQALGPQHVLLGVVLFNLAHNDDELGQSAAALPHAQRASQILAARLGTRHAITLRALNQLGTLFVKLDELERAQKTFEFTLPLRRDVLGADSTPALQTQAALAHTLTLRGRYAEANRLMQGVVAGYQRSRGADDAETLSAMLDSASTFGALGDYEAALQLAQRVLDVRAAQFGRADARTLSARQVLASAMAQTGRFAEALALQQEVLEGLRRTLGASDGATLSAALALAHTYAMLGRTQEAETLYAQVAKDQEQLYGADAARTLSTRLDLAGVYAQLGRHAEAGVLQQQVAQRAQDKLGPKNPLTLSAVSGLSATLHALGQWARAVELQRWVVSGRSEALGPGHRDTLAARHNLALRLMALGEKAEARTLVESALADIEAGAPQHAAMADLPYYYRTLGELLIQLGDAERAERALRRGLALVEQTLGADSVLAGHLCNFLAKALAAHAAAPPGQGAQQLALHARALAIGRATGATDVSWRAADGLRAVHEAMGNAPAAVHYGKQAINSIQATRQGLGHLAQALQQGFLADKRHVYTETADLLIAQGRLAEGQQVLALLKQDEYFDFVSRGDAAADPAQSRLSLNRQEQAWVARYEAVSDRLVEISKRKAVLDARMRSGTLSDEERAQRAQFEGDLAAARAAFDAATRLIAEESRRLAAAGQDARLGAEVIDSVRAMRDDLKELGHGAVLVHYLMASDRLWILLTTPEVQVAREVRVAAAELNRRIDALRSALRTPRGDALAPAQALYQLLLAPIARDLDQAKARTLMLSLDGALRYVPFAALHDGRAWAVETWRFALLTEAAKSRIKDAPKADWTITALGLTRAVDGLPALPAVREELSGLVRSGASPQGVMDGELMFDDAFTVAAVEGALGDPNPVLHIASHFKFTPGTEADSYLLMGDGGRLSLQQIRQRDLRFRVDLLTLSACDTAVGDNARGQEVEGLGALAQKQGAKAVLATLWPVADGSTGLFMREMYRRRAEQRLTKAEAIRQVQLAFLKGLSQADTGAAERGVRVQGAAAATAPAVAPGGGRYAHPFYWAPFILMGNWL